MTSSRPTAPDCVLAACCKVHPAATAADKQLRLAGLRGQASASRPGHQPGSDAGPGAMSCRASEPGSAGRSCGTSSPTHSAHMKWTSSRSSVCMQPHEDKQLMGDAFRGVLPEAIAAAAASWTAAATMKSAPGELPAPGAASRIRPKIAGAKA